MSKVLEMATCIVSLQDNLNSAIDKNYRNKGHNYDSAIIVETGELLDSLDYKWWKSGKTDLSNAFVETIDILHFIVSKITVQHGYSIAVNELNCFLSHMDDEDAIKSDKLVTMATAIVEENIGQMNYSIHSLTRLMSSLGYNVDEVFKAYITKNCLNAVRADNGYKEGTYIKMWAGEEDNVKAFELATLLNLDTVGVSNFYDTLYSSLTAYYNNEVLL